MEGQTLFNAANFSVGVINDTYGMYANSTVSVTRLAGVPLPVQHLAQLYDVALCGAPDERRCSGLLLLRKCRLELRVPGRFRLFASAPPNGAFQEAGSAIGLANITDGTSNTVAFGEWKIGTGNENAVTIPQDIIFPHTSPAGVTRNTATVYMPAAWPSVLSWLQTCGAMAGDGSQLEDGPMRR